jgi:hypothetical protein
MKKTLFTVIAMALAVTSCTKDENLSPEEEINAVAHSWRQSNASEVTLDFEGFEAGTIISSLTPDVCEGEIAVRAFNPRFPDDNTAMIFDSSDPTGNDDDLGTPSEFYGGPGESEEGPQESNDTALGNVLIISEDLDSNDPDDSNVAGTFYEFDFSGYAAGEVTMVQFTMLDLDAPGANDLSTVVKLYDVNDVILLEKVVPFGPDNAKQFVDLENTSGVVKMVLELNNSGAIDDIQFECEGKDGRKCRKKKKRKKRKKRRRGHWWKWW